MTIAHDSAAIQSISYNVYQTILAIQQTNPGLLNEKYRNFPWHRQSDFINRLAAELSNTASRDALVLKVIKTLQAFFVPSFFVSLEFINLTKNIRQIIHKEAETKPNGSESQEAIAILLLDTENLQIDVEAEKFLAKVCTYPIQVKIAFANWRNLGKLDAEFHQRGYDLIHVPAGRDNADGKMIAVGLSLREHYPKVREVLVCSSDMVMTNLCNHLHKCGLTVYRVSRQGDNIKIFNNQTGKIETYSTEKLPEIPALPQFINDIKSLIKAEQKRAAIQWIKLSRISALFQAKHKITISQVVSVHFPGKRARDLFIDGKSDFVVHTPPEQSELYITLFETAQPNAANNHASAEITAYVTTHSHTAESTNYHLPAELKTPSQQRLSVINSLAELEQALIKIVMDLTAQSSGAYIEISKVGTEFQKQYSQPLKQIILRLDLKSKFLQVLQSCNAFKLKKSGKVYQVAIREAYSSGMIAQHSVSNIKSRSDLEQVLVNILKYLTVRDSQKSMPIEILGSEFHKHYGITITAMMKHLKLDDNFAQFLQSCSAFQVENTGTTYKVAIANS